MSYENCNKLISFIRIDEISKYLSTNFPIASIATSSSKNKATIQIFFLKNQQIQNPNYYFFKSFIPFLKKQPKLIYFDPPNPKIILNEILTVISNLSIRYISIKHNNKFNFTLTYNYKGKIIADKVKKF
jgi:hypothetical protein